MRFRRPSDVTTCIIDAIAGTLSVHARGESELASPEPAPLVLAPVLEPLQQELQLRFHSASCQYSTPNASSGPPQPRELPQQHVAPVPKPHTPSCVQPEPIPPVPAPPAPFPVDSAPVQNMPNFRYIGVLADSYILFENKDGLVLLSPRSARERIIFERLLESNRRPVSSQRLLVPALLELDPRDMGVALDVREQLQQAGFLISPLRAEYPARGGRPHDAQSPRVEEFMLELIRSFSSGETRLKRSRNPFEPYAILIAKRYSAREDLRPWLKAPIPLLTDLLRCEIPYCTPSGKPTLIPITMNELDRKFRAM